MKKMFQKERDRSMKRQHVASDTDSSGQPKEKIMFSSDYKNEFVAEWIAKLQEPGSFENSEKIYLNSKNNNKKNISNSENFKYEKEKDLELILKSICELDDNWIDITGITSVNKMSHGAKKLKENTTDSEWEQVEHWTHIHLFTLVDYPDGTVVHGMRFKEFPIEPLFKDIANMHITISDFVRPFKFYFLSSKLRTYFLNMMQSIKKDYDQMDPNKLVMNSCHIFPGQICAVPTGRCWARGIVSDYLMGKTIKVFLVDFGTEISIESKLLKYLKTAYLEQPRQSIRGSLANLSEQDPESNKKIKALLKKHTFGKEFSANILKTVKLHNKYEISFEIWEVSELLIKNDFVKCFVNNN